MRYARCLGGIVAVMALGALLSGCGPGLLALAGGTGGGILGFQSSGGGKEKKGGSSSNSAPIAVVNSVTREDAPATITYTLIDANDDLCSVYVAYSLNGIHFFPCTQAPGGSPTTFLNSGTGATHTFEWDYERDLLTEELVTGISIAITPNDGKVDGLIGYLTNQSVGNDAPVIMTSTSPASPSVLVNGGLVLVNFVLADSSSDIGAMVVGFTLDQGQTFTQLDTADYVGTPPFALLTTPSGASGQFIWNSNVALPNFVGNNVLLALIPVDKPNGWNDYTVGNAVIAGPFSLNNIANGPPQLEIVSALLGTSQVGTVEVQFTLTDSGSDSAVVALEYSADGAPFVPARLVGQAAPVDAGPFVCSPNPRLYSIRWDALADLGSGSAKVVELRLTPAQFGASSVVGNPALTGQFTVTPNEAPEITDFQVYQNSGNITVRLRVQDSTADPVSLSITAFWGGGTNSYPLSSADFVAGDITSCASNPGGEDNLFIWNTTLTGAPLANINAADVYWEVTPTDNPPGVPSAALQGPIFTSGTFPVINDINGAAPIAINLTEDSGAVTVNVSQQRNFTALIQPSAALDHTVNWDIVEGAGYGTVVPVSSPTQGPQTAMYTAPPVLPMPNNGYATVRCVSTVDSSVSATWRLYFGNPPVSVGVSPNTANVVLGQTLQLNATVNPGSAPQYVTWQVLGGSSYGSINSSGLYTAPTTMPMAGRTLTIRAFSVNPSVFGDATLTLQPLPAFCLVTSAVGGSTGPSQVTLGQTFQLVATIDPSEAPQQVYWTIDWNGVGQGSGNPTVGTVSSSGLYTAPSNLPTPSQVFVRARSQIVSSVTDDYQIDLVAPPPTSFQVSPATATVTAGGAGVDFDVVNFVPSNANRAVTWSMNPVFGTLDTQTGLYTPPPNSSTTTNVTIRATSTVAPSVFAEGTVTVMPNAQVPPQNVIITPAEGRTFVSGRALQFTASVLPSGASQSVSWTVVNGPGSINGSGVYSPPVSSTQLDATARIRCASTVDSNIWEEATIEVCGAGDASSLSVGNVAMGRSEAVAFHDGSFNRVFYCGGYSENDQNKHDDQVMVHNLQNNTWSYVARMMPTQSANTIAWAHDVSNKFLYAIVGNGASGAVGVYRLNISVANPAWASVSAGGSGGDIPILGGNFRYLAFFDPGLREILLCVPAGNTIYRLDVNTPANVSWKTKRTNVVGSSATPVTEKCAYFFDSNRNRHTLIGSGGAVVSTRVWYLDMSGSWSWQEVTTTGPGPSGGIDDASASWDESSKVALVFGGKPPVGNYTNTLYYLNTNNIPYAWVSNSIIINPRSAAARGRAAVFYDGWQLFVFGGRNNTGIFGDLWTFDTSNGWSQPAPEGLRPQGRRSAAATWVHTWSAGWVYGGICDYGVSDEMWRLEYDTAKGGWAWYLEAPNPLAVTHPGPLQGASLTWDPINSRLLLFGGASNSASPYSLSNVLYRYDPSSFGWSIATTSGGPPPARFAHSTCYQSDDRLLVIFGGLDNNGTNPYRSDIWLFNVQTNAYSQPTVSGSIEGRAWAIMGYNAKASRALVLGGVTLTSGSTLQLYELQFTSSSSVAWTALATHQFTTPKAVSPGAGAYDDGNARFITAPPGQFDNQALVFCQPVQGANPPPTWQSLTIGGVSHGHGAIGMWDPDNARFIAFGGENDLGGGKFRKLNQIRVVRFK